MRVLISLFVILYSTNLMAQSDAFKAGKVIKGYGKIAEVDGMDPLPAGTKFKVSFDVYKPAEKGEVNRSIDSIARFLNMHVAAGGDIKDIELAVVIHGGATNEMTSNDYYQKKMTADNVNIDLISQLQSHGVVFYVCGQSAAYHQVSTKDLISGVKMSLSAMTAHALLQQQGYTLNPF